MRKLTRMAAIGGVGLLALTACGDDEPEQEETPESAEEQDSPDEAPYSAQDMNDRVAEEGYESACEGELDREPGSYTSCELVDGPNEDTTQVILLVDGSGNLEFQPTGEHLESDSEQLSEFEDPAEPSNPEDIDEDA